MNIPRFWRRVEPDPTQPNPAPVPLWGWSTVSEDAALAKAQDRLAQLTAWLRAHQSLDDRPRWYGYPDRPIREEIVREIPGPDGQPAALVTRNAYGCLVLNTARMLFADVDFTPADSGGGWLRRLFGDARPARADASAPEAATLQQVNNWVAAHPDAGVRIYRTKAGLRLLLTHREFEPASADSESTLAALSNDPLYIRLCRSQKCYRARLTPKPWRCGVATTTERFPFATPEKQAAFARWLLRYEHKARRFATCQFVTTVGQTAIHPELAALVRLHDELSGIGSPLPLA